MQTGPVAAVREPMEPPRTYRPHEIRVVGRPWSTAALDLIANRTGLFWIVSAFGAFWTFGFFREARRGGESLLWASAQAIGMALLSIGGAFFIIILLYFGRAAFVALASILEWAVVNVWRGARRLLRR